MSFESEKLIFGHEHIDVIEIDLDYCTNVFGQAPCTASGSGDAKCFNTLETTQDLPNFTLFSDTGNQQIDCDDFGNSFTLASGNFEELDFKQGDSITTSGFSNAANNGTFTIILISPSNRILVEPTAFVTETGSGDERIVSNTRSNIKTYRFCTQRSPHPIGLEAIPSIINVGVTPSVIDIKGGLGQRSTLSVSFKDHPHSDIGIDKYIDERTWIAFERGTFWTKWRARNPNYKTKAIRHLSGYLIDGVFDAANFETRSFIIDRVDVSNGRATVIGKDPLKLASSKKAQAPAPSTGLLSVGINDSVTSATLIPAGVGNLEYETAGFVLMQSEVCEFTRSGDALTLVRGVKNTPAAAHSANDTVQQCLEYSGSTRGKLDFILNDLLTNFANLDTNFIPLSAWDAEVSTFLSGLLSGIIVKPMDVNKILKELSEAMPHRLWWDEKAQLVQLTALKAPPLSAAVLNMDENLVGDSVRISDKPDMRISTVFVSFGQINPTKKLDEIDNWTQTYVRVDTDSINKYGSSEVKSINSRWILNSNKGAAIQLAALIGRRFSDIPREIQFSLNAKDSDVWIGQSRSVNHRDLVDATGIPLDTMFEITSASESGDYKYKGLEFRYGGVLPDDEGGGDPDVDLVYISPDEEGLAQNVVMRDVYDLLFPTPDASTQVIFIVEAGTTVGSTSTSTFSLDTGSWPAGATITLQNSGIIVGRGGDGGVNGFSGDAGGDAIELNFDLELINLNIIGGGGGGGGAATDTQVKAGGGGGAGDDIGPGGPSSAESQEEGQSVNAANGTTELGGNRGTADDTANFAVGGSGGDLGIAGNAATVGSTTGSGGAAGNAIDKNGFTLTQTTTGDIRGSIIT